MSNFVFEVDVNTTLSSVRVAMPILRREWQMIVRWFNSR